MTALHVPLKTANTTHLDVFFVLHGTVGPPEQTIVIMFPGEDITAGIAYVLCGLQNSAVLHITR